jgi:citronellol/citronellal dehydrogenase
MKDSELYRPHCRNVDIIADAALGVLTRDARSFTGNFLEDEDFLRDQMGVTSFDQYVVTDASKL